MLSTLGCRALSVIRLGIPALLRQFRAVAQAATVVYRTQKTLQPAHRVVLIVSGSGRDDQQPSHEISAVGQFQIHSAQHAVRFLEQFGQPRVTGKLAQFLGIEQLGGRIMPRRRRQRGRLGGRVRAVVTALIRTAPVHLSIVRLRGQCSENAEAARLFDFDVPPR
jgi:hypothetical protein